MISDVFEAFASSNGRDVASESFRQRCVLCVACLYGHRGCTTADPASASPGEWQDADPQSSANFTINVAAQGMRRLRFLTPSPDGRIFATDMHDLGDNTLGTVYILRRLGRKDRQICEDLQVSRSSTQPENLPPIRNLHKTGSPRSRGCIFHSPTDCFAISTVPATSATGPPEVLASYPDYGLNYKYGGWHLTRTVALATLHGKPRLYVTVGSLCDACNEKEEIRATLTAMDPDGAHQEILARGLRNAVGMEFIPSIDGGALFATNMGADHLGNQAPEDTFFDSTAMRIQFRPVRITVGPPATSKTVNRIPTR